VLGEAYAYGHLVPAALSLAMALAFTVLALRVDNHRRDLAYALAAALAGLVALGAMWVALAPSLVAARVLFTAAIALYAVVPTLWHLQFAHLVWPEVNRRLHRTLIGGFVAAGASFIALLWTGALDQGAIRHLELGGATSAVAALSGWSAAVLFGFALTIVPLSAHLLLRPGPRRRERRSALPLMLIAPPLCGHDLLLAAGALDSVPIGGYLAGLASLQGVVILAERFRALTEGPRIGPYKLERRLGEGGMAEVFVARRTGAGPMAQVEQRVALKRLRRASTGDPEVARTLIAEARALARLDHENVVRLLDAGEADGELFLALELVDGATLAALLAAARQGGRALGPALAVEIGRQAAAALAAAHALSDERGAPLDLIHRDVTPHNLLVDRTGRVKLADFGLARSLDRTAQTATGVVKGKLPYVAPEPLRGEPYDRRVDLYALGVVMFEVALGVRPFDADSDALLIGRILAGTPCELDRLRALGPPAALIERLLASAPADRPATADEVAAELEVLAAAGARATLAAAVTDALTVQIDDEPRTRRL
jgi:tRNA A-37 threonylcarbamoyl transferase component Bud32